MDNVGAASATVDIVSDNSKFVVSPANVIIDPGTPVEISVAYTPTEEGVDSGYIILTHGGDSSPDSVMVQGAGSLNILTEGFDGPWTGDPAAPLGWTVVNSDGDFTHGHNLTLIYQRSLALPLTEWVVKTTG